MHAARGSLAPPSPPATGASGAARPMRRRSSSACRGVGDRSRTGWGMVDLMRDMLRNTRRIISGFKPVKVPDAPARSFRDLWPGDAARGARLMRGEYETMGAVRGLDPTHEGDAGWDETAGPPAWRAAAPGVAWP